MSKFDRSYFMISANEGRIILDGEMLVYDPVTDRNLPFGSLKTAALGKFIMHAIIASFMYIGLQIKLEQI